jgi:quercetin dioxygenase-like cupin family protein
MNTSVVTDQASLGSYVPSSLSQRRRFAILGGTVDIHATTEETGNCYSIVEVGVPPRFPGPPPHYHERTTESLYLLEGTLEILRDDEWTLAHRGDFFLIPPGTVHAYRNCTEHPARFLIMGPGHDRYYFELVDWMYREPIWPPTDREALVAFGLRHDTIYV